MPKSRPIELPGRHRGVSAGSRSRNPAGPAVGGHRKTLGRTSRRTAFAAVITVCLITGPALTGAAVAETHTVQAGETLSQIAQRHGTTWRRLYQLNRRVVSSPNVIFAGQALEVDGDTVERAGRATPPDGGEGLTPSSGSFVHRVLAEAAKVKGVPYVYGGTTPAHGFDCSGFTSYVFAKAGKAIPRTSGAQAEASRQISGSDLRAGDLIFYRPSRRVSHVAIYAGNGMVWEAPSTGKQVQYAPIWNVPRSYGRF